MAVFGGASWSTSHGACHFLWVTLPVRLEGHHGDPSVEVLQGYTSFTVYRGMKIDGYYIMYICFSMGFEFYPIKNTYVITKIDVNIKFMSAMT